MDPSVQREKPRQRCGCGGQKEGKRERFESDLQPLASELPAFPKMLVVFFTDRPNWSSELLGIPKTSTLSGWVWLNQPDVLPCRAN